MILNKLELLAPAGSLLKLKTALLYGADAVYCAGKEFGLRAGAENFTLPELQEGVIFAHEREKKVYLALNIIPREDDLLKLPKFIKAAADTGVDAFIISDPGVLTLAKKYAPTVEIHLSTQANCTNSISAEFWQGCGVSRVVLARELTLLELSRVHKAVPSLELEAFVHGAMCVSYSGRCLLSNYLAGRESNAGACAQPCRWGYHLTEEKRPNEHFPVFEDERGTYIMNSKDLCLISRLRELADAGICSFKIEGRMKSEFYLASVVAAYRRAISDMLAGAQFDKELLNEVKKVSHRDYFEGFLDGADRVGENVLSAGYIRSYEYMAYVEGYDELSGCAYIRQRGKFLVGDELEAISPNEKPRGFTVTAITRRDGTAVKSTPHADEELLLAVPFSLAPASMLRKKARDA